MAAAANGLARGGESTESSSNTMADQMPYQAVNRTQTSPLHLDDQIKSQAVTPAHPPDQNNDSKVGSLDAPLDGTPVIVPIGGPMYVTPPERLDEKPEYIDCPSCKRRTQTRVSHTDSSSTTLAGVVCCMFTCIGACIPCICGWCQDTDHHCSECGSHIMHRTHEGVVQVISLPPRRQVSRFGARDESSAVTKQP